ncbi:MAG: zinc-binding dehydrogenase [Mollicutes bacterium]|nr:MAG: zinc-binding dehydrogenase [Mollicutes bacterium]
MDGTVPLKYCAILESFGNAYHTQSVSEIEGKNVLVTGDGPIAIFAALIVQTRNPKNLFITGINEFRKNIARKCGLNLIDPMQTDLKTKIMEETNNEGIDVVLEFTGNAEVLESVVDIISELGDINILSIYPQQKILIRLNELTFKNVRIQTILGRKI